MKLHTKKANCLSCLLLVTLLPNSWALTSGGSSRRDWIATAVSSAALPLLSAPQLTLAAEPEAPFIVALKVQLPDKNIDGVIEIEVHPEWAPLASARFKELVTLGFYDDARIYRVLPNYVAQFGIASDPALNKEWMFCEANCRAIPDEPRLKSNEKETLSFASRGKNTRQTQVFINTGNNGGPPNFLDGQGFVPFAKVVNGMDLVGKLNAEYGLKESLSGGITGTVNQGKAAYFGKEYLDTVFPRLSIIESAKIL